MAQETVAEIMARDAARQALDTVPGVDEEEGREAADRALLPQAPGSPAVAAYPEARADRIAWQPTTNPDALSVGTSFLAAQTSEASNPPDTMGDVGPTQILICINGRIKVFDKLGNLGALNTDTNNFFGSVLPAGQNTVDPRVRYDRLAGRWFITMMTRSMAPNYILVAVSSSSTITSTTTFRFVPFRQDMPAPAGDNTNYPFADYATLGIDNQALYVGVNYKTSSTTGSGAYLGNSTVYVINKSDFLSSPPRPPRITAFRDIATGAVQSPPIPQVEGPQIPQGVDNDDPAATQGYFIGIDNQHAGQLVVRRVSNPGSGTPTLSLNLVVTTPTTSPPIDVPSPGSTCPLWALDSRLISARMHRGSLWAVHQIQVNSSGVASSGGGRDGARWYQIGSLGTTPTLIQSGTLFDSAASSPRSYFYASCAANGQGHMTLAASAAGANEYAEIAVAQRLAGDALGTLQAPSIVQSSSFAFNLETCSQTYPFQKWGDYSITTVDPTDDMTFWTAQKYANATNSWGVRVVQIKAPPPATAASASPASVVQGQASVNVAVTGTAVGGSGFFDPGAGYPNHLSATVDGAVTVNSVTYVDPTHITLNVSTVGATVGTHTITVTNPDGQRVTGAAGILTVTASPIYQGYHEGADCQTIWGWAWDKNQPNTPINVDLYNGTALFGTAAANLFRSDLLSAGIGNGYHAFNTTVPSSLKDGQPHSIRVRFGGTASDLTWTPRWITCGGTQTPYTGSPATIPGTIEAENFDNGGEGVAYHDSDPANVGGQYRSTGVDIATCTDTSGCYYVGWAHGGEWMEYTVSVATAGTYTLQARVASGGSGGTFHVELNGVNKTGTLTIPNTGGWDTWQTITKTVTLDAGTQVLRLALDGDGATGYVGNFNYLRF